MSRVTDALLLEAELAAAITAVAEGGPPLDFDAWARRIPTLVWITDAKVDRFVGDGPLVTDDRPFSEYFFLRNTFGAKSPPATRSLLVRLSRS